MHSSYFSDLVPIYESLPRRCANGVEILRVPIACAVLVYFATEIFVLDVQ